MAWLEILHDYLMAMLILSCVMFVFCAVMAHFQRRPTYRPHRHFDVQEE